jgi:hypothetical protein
MDFAELNEWQSSRHAWNHAAKVDGHHIISLGKSAWDSKPIICLRPRILFAALGDG